MGEILESFKSLLKSSKFQFFVVSQFAGILIVYVAGKVGLPADDLANIVLALLGKAGVEASALQAARGYVDAHTSSAAINAEAVRAHVPALPPPPPADAVEPVKVVPPSP